MPTTQPLKVHITGVYGLIGNLMYRHLSSQPELYDVYGSGRRAVSSERADRDAILPLPDDHFMIADLSDDPAVREHIPRLEQAAAEGRLPAAVAAEKLLEIYLQKKDL